MSPYLPFRRPLAMCALAALALSALAASVQDSFSNANAPAFWAPNDSGGGSTVRTGGALAVSADSNGEPFSFGGYFCSQYALDLNASWSSSYSYSLKAPMPPVGGVAGAVMFMVFPDGKSQAVYAFMAYKSRAGNFLGILTIGETGFNLQPICPVPASGKLSLSYVAAADRLTLLINNQPRYALQHFSTMPGVTDHALFGLGGIADHGTGNYKFNKGILIDNFAISGGGLIPGAPF